MEVLSVAKSALQLLRNKIITGELIPGQRLNEPSLSKELDISRTPLRETFRILEEDHLAVNIPRRGTFVAKLSLEDCEEICQTREMIEFFTVDLLKASNVRYLPKVETALGIASTLTLPLNRTNPDVLLNGIMLLIDFHYSLIDATGNSRIIGAYRSISYNLARYQYIYFNVDGTGQHSLGDHEKILKLIGDGGYDQAKEKLREHIKSAEELVKNRLFR
jgi:DNA-binding GntR family transcriptional regulator